MSEVLAKILLTFIRFYQYVISPLLPARCRFYPTCSQYGVVAVQRHGGIKGGWLTVKRICRCHPWGGSGVDFVPLALARYHYRFFADDVRQRAGYGVNIYIKPV